MGGGGLRAGLALPRPLPCPWSQSTEASSIGEVVTNGEQTGTALVPTLGTSQPAAAQRQELQVEGETQSTVQGDKCPQMPQGQWRGAGGRCAYSSWLPAARKAWPSGKMVTGCWARPHSAPGRVGH